MRLGHSTVVAASLKDVVTNADIIWSCVKDQEAVEQIFAEILSSTQSNLRGKLFVESSTILPDVTNHISKQVLEAGGEFVAMPGTKTLHPMQRFILPSKLRTALSEQYLAIQALPLPVN